MNVLRAAKTGLRGVVCNRVLHGKMSWIPLSLRTSSSPQPHKHIIFSLSFPLFTSFCFFFFVSSDGSRALVRAHLTVFRVASFGLRRVRKLQPAWLGQKIFTSRRRGSRSIPSSSATSSSPSSACASVPFSVAAARFLLPFYRAKNKKEKRKFHQITNHSHSMSVLLLIEVTQLWHMPKKR